MQVWTRNGHEHSAAGTGQRTGRQCTASSHFPHISDRSMSGTRVSDAGDGCRDSRDPGAVHQEGSM